MLDSGNCRSIAEGFIAAKIWNQVQTSVAVSSFWIDHESSSAVSVTGWVHELGSIVGSFGPQARGNCEVESQCPYWGGANDSDSLIGP